MICAMPREPKSYRLDTRVIAAIDFFASRAGIEPQQYLELYFFNKGKEHGVIPPDAQPLGETRGSVKGQPRGAAKKGSKRKPKKSDEGTEE